MKEFKYLWILFMGDSRIRSGRLTQIGAVSAVMWILYQIVVVKRKVRARRQSSLFSSQSMFEPSPMVVTERMKLQKQAVEWRFLCKVLCRVSRLSLRDKVKSLESCCSFLLKGAT